VIASLSDWLKHRLERLRMTDKSAATLVEDGLVKVSEATAFLRLSRSTLYTMMDRGELAFVKLGRSRRIPRRALVELAARELRGGVR
jgi:excisionase family DNA binding protein